MYSQLLNICWAKKYITVCTKLTIINLVNWLIIALIWRFTKLFITHISYQTLQRFKAASVVIIVYISKKNVLITLILLSREAVLFSVIPKQPYCMKSVQIQGFFWSVFSYIWTEYGDLWSNKFWVHKVINFNKRNITLTNFLLLKYYLSHQLFTLINHTRCNYCLHVKEALKYPHINMSLISEPY